MPDEPNDDRPMPFKLVVEPGLNKDLELSPGPTMENIPQMIVCDPSDEEDLLDWAESKLFKFVH